jgi:hypothetical protein
MLLQLDPPVPVETPKGKGLAHVLIDYGLEIDLVWIVFIDESRECWSFRNRDVRGQANITFGRQPKQIAFHPNGPSNHETQRTGAAACSASP